ncbi:IDE [Cordylochernes scorpioides]|uniref:IDE n=1 Tax=Cordylochernes scorpioides TaxID=51811 RepID=A0ABY6L4R1_9ARAC|nr:IDE [Cordylochernes scorpioides]
MLTRLCGQVIKEAAFNTLRTQEQLGYIVSSQVTKQASTISLHLLVQSDRELTLVDSRIEAFLSSIQVSLKTMSSEEFDNHKKSLESMLTEKPKFLFHRFAKLWAEIESQQYNFERRFYTGQGHLDTSTELRILPSNPSLHGC